MTNSNKSRRWGASKYALLATTALVTAFGAPGAMAQDAETDTDENAEARDVVVVRGVRGALLNARNIRRNSDTLVDSIAATDVSELPDLSVAEALSRVPGVVTQRFELGGSDGDFPSPEGSGNIIRGLQYVRSEFNGRDAFSANGGRALEWASIPPELIGAVEVYKNQTASMVEGGISGTVNLRTLLPFDRDDRIAVFAADQTFTDLAEEWSPGFSVVLGDSWDTANGRFGLLGSFSTSELQSNINGFQYGPLLAISNPDVPSTNMALPGGWQARDADINRARDSYYLASQWRSSGGNVEFSFTAIRVENEIETNERTIEFFTDAESWASWSILDGPGSRSFRPFASEGLPRCNGAGEAANGGIGICENLIPVGSGLMESGVVSNNLRDWLGQTGNLQTPLQSLAIAQRQESMTQDFAANLQWRVSDRLFVELDAHYTEAEASLQRLWTGGNHFADYRFDFSDIENPQIELFMSDQVRLADWGGTFRGADPGILGDLNDPRYAFLLYSADEFQDNSGDLFATRGDAQYEFDGDGWFDSIDFGARYSRREQNNRSAGLNWAAIAPPWAGGYLPYANLTDGAYDVHNFADFQRGGVFLGTNTSIVFPSRAQMQDYTAFVNMLAGQPLIGGGVNGDGNLQLGDWVPLRQNGVVDYANRGSDGSVREETFNAYFQTNYSRELQNGQSLSGNFGLRYINSETTGGGILSFAELAADNPADPTQPRDFLPETAAYLDQANTQNSISNSYSYVLPSFNLRWDLNDEWLVRVAASRAITPANIADLNSNQSQVAELGFVVDPTATPPVITDVVLGGINVFGGNPNLAPIESTNLDVAVEWYFGSDGLFTVSAFYKELENIIVYGEEVVDTITLDGYTVPVTYFGNTNRNNGNVEGIEIAYQQFFTEWPGLLGNLGVQANFTYLASEATALPTVRDQDSDGVDGFLTVYRWGVADLLGLSDYSYNLIGIYQSDTLEARLAYNWRSEYVSSYRDYITGNPIIQDDIGFLDASVRWDITDNITVRAQVANILDTKSVAYQQVDARGQRFGRSVFVNDRRFEFGLRYEF
ncbi:TonB-dependent receptor [Hyphobacterium sp. HN65]|uniref:TonB-dependent receptor n=1 Tax=Hyphobacterium lacteum TaxID=3116575 RepID=A0ABU7LSD3_9PROT|nr:TonB-dependent receptor [Hyphobacterium sp. HN65]MEE2526833.1 TonB-dependent receptor [Hyphobacterium sp. HN65]